MNAKNAKKLFDKFDYMFLDRTLDPSKTSMCWGFQCGDGWFGLLFDLCLKIDTYLNKHSKIKERFKVNQVKEKFGSLRFYVYPCDDTLTDIIVEAEDLSAITCEVCGKLGKIHSVRGWKSCLCNKCLKEG